MSVVVVRRAVRFEEVDAAGILFFAHFFAYAHGAMERLFDAVAGGYAQLITERRVGFPAVKTAAEFFAPLRYGDVARIEARLIRLGNRSAEIGYVFKRDADDRLCAALSHTVVATDLHAMKSCDLPADVRAALAAHD